MPVTRQRDTTIMTPETIQAMIGQALQRNPTNTHDDRSKNSGGGPGRPVQPALLACLDGSRRWNQYSTSAVVFATCTLLGVALT
ncbi:hypothetical protein Tco_1494910 [Tanacetum coccineum]